MVFNNTANIKVNERNSTLYLISWRPFNVTPPLRFFSCNLEVEAPVSTMKSIPQLKQ